jgi:hypothetical protein
MTVSNGVGATVGDCARLWLTLTKEYIPALRIEMTLVNIEDGAPGLRVELVDGPHSDTHNNRHLNIWSTRVFFNPLHLISSSSLFELLIAGYRQIDDFFTHGESFAPVRREV